MESNNNAFRNPSQRFPSISFLSARSNLRSNLPPLQPSSHSTSRPFTLINPLPSVHIPHLNIPSLNNQISSMEQQVFPSPAPKRIEVKCQYCNTSLPNDELAEHAESCNMRKIPCERCGERVLLDIYDIHFEECLEAETQPNEGNPRIATIASIANMYMRARAGNEMEDDSVEDEENMEEEDEGFFLDESEMTYERLLMLDANVVKKGMNSEQLKEFPVQLYVRSLDGEGSCVVCMCDYETGEYVRKLSCNHNFHKGCIDKWLDANITCPTCKKYLR